MPYYSITYLIKTIILKNKDNKICIYEIYML